MFPLNCLLSGGWMSGRGIHSVGRIGQTSHCYRGDREAPELCEATMSVFR